MSNEFKIIMVIWLFCLLVAGCNWFAAKSSTESLDSHIPKDAIEAEAMSIYRAEISRAENETLKLKADIENQKRFNLLSIFFIVGMVGSVVAIILGVKAIVGIAGFSGCAIGLGLAWANIQFPLVLGLFGLVVGIGAGGYAIFVWVSSLKKVVAGNEIAKEEISQMSFSSLVPSTIKDVFSAAQNETQGSTDKVKSATTKLVDKIRNKKGE